jgi:polysaccharide export outer membrane protein
MVRTILTMVFCCMASLASAQGYQISIGDRLDVSVLEDPGLNRQVLVRPDGLISFPLAGALQAAGRTPEALATDIRRSLSRDFIEPPTVTVALVGVGDEQNFPVIYVIGEVRQPGRYELDRPTDLLQMLAQAGGLSPFAASRRIQLRRHGEAGAEVTFFDYDVVTSGEVPLPQIFLSDGDVVVVPERGLFE